MIARLPPLNALPKGCAFAPRCPRAMERCRQELPELKELDAKTVRLAHELALHDEGPRASVIEAYRASMEDALRVRWPAERWLRDAKLEEIWEGTSDIMRLIISRSLFPRV